jgi:hypothetical protein
MKYYKIVILSYSDYSEWNDNNDAKHIFYVNADNAAMAFKKFFENNKDLDVDFIHVDLA